MSMQIHVLAPVAILPYQIRWLKWLRNVSFLLSNGEVWTPWRVHHCLWSWWRGRYIMDVNCRLLLGCSLNLQRSCTPWFMRWPTFSMKIDQHHDSYLVTRKKYEYNKHRCSLHMTIPFYILLCLNTKPITIHLRLFNCLPYCGKFWISANLGYFAWCLTVH